MVERGRAVYDIFLSKGVTLKPKKLASAITTARIKRHRNVRLNRDQSFLLKICQEIEIKPATVRHWLEFLSTAITNARMTTYDSVGENLFFSRYHRTITIVIDAILVST